MSALKKLHACTEGANWADEKESYQLAWNQCDRGDWMLWVAYKRNVDIKKLTKIKVECAKLVEHVMKDERSINALRVAEKFADGEATKDELDAAAYAAYAAYAADAADAAYAAAAAYAADAADAAYAAAAAAADAAYAAAAADAAAYARQYILSKAADICRKYIDYSDLKMEEIS